MAASRSGHIRTEKAYPAAAVESAGADGVFVEPLDGERCGLPPHMVEWTEIAPGSTLEEAHSRALACKPPLGF